MRRLLSGVIQADVTEITAPLASAVVEPIGSIDLSNTDLYTAVSDPTEITQLEDPTTPALVLDFDMSTPIPFFYLNGGDVALTLNGVAVQSVYSTNPPELVDGNNGELILPLIEQNSSQTGWQPIPLSPGSYQVTLVGGSGLASAIENFPESFTNQTVAQVKILGSSASFQTIPTTNVLGTLGSTVDTLDDQTLDPDDPSSSVDLYEFTLAPGHYWRVGAAVSAQNIGSPLSADLTLFDSQGNVIETRVAGTGVGDDPGDPYLFTGLAPGTYYLGVSGAGNLPYSPTNPVGYNAILGSPGSSGVLQAEGQLPFDLSVVANTADQPTRVTSFTLDSVAPGQSGPTGFTVTFSGPINASQILTTDTQQDALEVVDSSGRVWPTTAMSYQVVGSQLTMIFDQSLPAGSYSLVVPAQGGLTDLAGISVASGSGSSDVLAHWNVTASPEASVAGGGDNLGVLWPLAADGTWPSPNAELTGTTELRAGQAQSYQFDIIVPAIYELSALVHMGDVRVVVTGVNGAQIYDQTNSTYINDDYFHLSAGAYTLTFTAVGSGAASVSWFLRPSHIDYEMVTSNGVGQSNALAFWLNSASVSNNPGSPGLNSPSGGNASGSVDNGSSGSESGISLGGGLAAGSEAATSVLIPASPIPSNLLVTLQTNVVGLPQASAMNVAAVGPMVEAGMSAIADRSSGLTPGIRYGASSETEQPVMVSSDEPEPVFAKEIVRKLRPDAVTGVADRDPDAASLGADRRALAQAEWLVRLVASLGEQIGISPLAPDELSRATLKTAAAEPALVAQTASDMSGKTRQNEARGNSGRLDAGLPLGVVVIAAVSYQMRRPVTRWWRGRRDVPTKNSAGRTPLGHGPHHRLGGNVTMKHERHSHLRSTVKNMQ